MLSHDNVLSNIRAMHNCFGLPSTTTSSARCRFSTPSDIQSRSGCRSSADVMRSITPIRRANKVGDLMAKHKGTLLLSTPRSVRLTHKCAKNQFSSLRFVLVGAEKLRDSVAIAFRAKFDVPLLEGYPPAARSSAFAPTIRTLTGGSFVPREPIARLKTRGSVRGTSPTCLSKGRDFRACPFCASLACHFRSTRKFPIPGRTHRKSGLLFRALL